MSRSERASRPVRAEMISAQIAIAVSSGVRAPMSSPIGAITRCELLVGDTRLVEPLDPSRVRAPGSHRAEIPDAGRQRADDRGHVELGVVGEHADCVVTTEAVADLREVAVGPVVHDFVGHRESLHRREHRTRVAHHHVVAEHLRDLGQRGGEVDRAEDHHARRRRERLDEHRHRVFACLAVHAVVPHRREARVELAERVARDDAVEVGIAERAQHVGGGRDSPRAARAASRRDSGPR